MRLIKCHINSFGKLKDFDFDFSDGVNTIFGENGLGKTTITVFLKAMFYGMPKKGNFRAYATIRSKFAPWDGGVYGGTLTFDDGQKVYTVSRTFGATPEGDTFQLVDEKTGKVSETYSKDLGIQLFGVGVETFEITAFLSQEGGLGDFNDEVRATLAGANKFKDDLASATRAEKLLSSAITQNKNICPKLAQIEELKRSIKQAENMQEQKRQELGFLQEKLAEVNESHSSLAGKEKDLKAEYASSLKAKERQKLLQEELVANKEKLASLNQEKLKLLEGKKIEKPKKKNNILKVGISLSVLALVLGIGFIIASFFIQDKIVMLTLGIVFVVLCLIAFGVTLIKRVGASESDKASEREELAFGLKLSQIQEGISGLEGLISQEENELESLSSQVKDIDFEKALGDIHGLDKEKSLLEIKLSNLKKDIAFEEDNLNEIKDKLLSLSEERSETLKKLELLEKTKEILGKARENVSVKYLQPMQEAFNEVYSLFNAKEKLSLDINLNINQVTNVGLKEKEYLSQGLQDLLSICRRFALLDKVFVKNKPFIVLDDPFVNLDDEKLNVAKALTAKYAEKYQIIYICSHSRCKI